MISCLSMFDVEKMLTTIDYLLTLCTPYNINLKRKEDHMSRLNQIIAIEKQIKSQAHAKLTETHQQLQKSSLLTGISRVYRPKDEEGEKLPSESTRVQLNAKEATQRAANTIIDDMNITATKDFANTKAFADVKIDGRVILPHVPVSTLLYLEKQLISWKTFVEKLPILDPSESWSFDEAQNCWRSDQAETTRTKKVPRNHVKAEATEKHPAQVEVYHEDIVVGYWRTTKFSGAIPAAHQANLLRRLDRFASAIKFAREEANSIQTEDLKIGSDVFNYLLDSTPLS